MSLKDFTTENAKVEIDADEVIEWVKQNCDPEDVFDETQLDAWAEANDYYKNQEP